MRASARETREVRELVEKALHKENSALKEELGKTRQELNRARDELKEQKFLPFVRRFIQGRGKVVEEVVAPEKPSSAAQKKQLRQNYM